jgi:hypothetical protein
VGCGERKVAKVVGVAKMKDKNLTIKEFFCDISLGMASFCRFQ